LYERNLNVKLEELGIECSSTVSTNIANHRFEGSLLTLAPLFERQSKLTLG